MKKLSLLIYDFAHKKVEVVMRRKKANNFCCHKLEMLLEDPASSVVYLPQTRTYILCIDGELTYSLNYCPCCGRKFPEDLIDRLVYIVHEESGLGSYDDPKLPQKFNP